MRNCFRLRTPAFFECESLFASYLEEIKKRGRAEESMLADATLAAIFCHMVDDRVEGYEVGYFQVKICSLLTDLQESTLFFAESSFCRSCSQIEHTRPLGSI